MCIHLMTILKCLCPFSFGFLQLTQTTHTSQVLILAYFTRQRKKAVLSHVVGKITVEYFFFALKSMYKSSQINFKDVIIYLPCRVLI
jgi:hypothetical protein